MEFLYNPIFLTHDTGMHPENMRRLQMFEGLPEAPLVDGAEYLPLVHTHRYIEKVRDACRLSAHLDADTVTSPGSFGAAVYAVGATIRASETGDFALVRPPGHHAYPNMASGFCLFNNVAIAATKLRNEGKRVLIFDFDGHLGDGTSDIFYEDDQVMYWSIHQYPAFPGHGFVDEIGEGKGKGFTVNVPLPPGSGDDIFLDAVNRFLPIAELFKPDVVAVSAGFDAHQYDLLLQLNVSATGFFKVGQMLAANFPRLFATLEGGYNLEWLRNSAYNFVAGINGQPILYPEKETSSGLRTWEEYEIRANMAVSYLSKYWKI
jgi:acetoin utilization deacetylase AcuC-like enzyme